MATAQSQSPMLPRESPLPNAGPGPVAAERDAATHPASGLLVSENSVPNLGTPEPLAAIEELQLSPACSRMTVAVAVSIPIKEFRVRHLLALMPGEVVETEWGHGEDLPLLSGDVQLAWSEFEVIDTRLAVRVTRLA